MSDNGRGDKEEGLKEELLREETDSKQPERDSSAEIKAENVKEERNVEVSRRTFVSVTTGSIHVHVWILDLQVLPFTRSGVLVHTVRFPHYCSEK